jgi:serine/threonine protein kinase
LLSYMSDAANGLDALNAKQVQHRDVKPANLLLLNSGVKVVTCPIRLRARTFNPECDYE